MRQWPPHEKGRNKLLRGMLLPFNRQSQRIDEKREQGPSSPCYMAEVVGRLSKRELCRDRTTWNSTRLHQEQYSVGVYVGTQEGKQSQPQVSSCFLLATDSSFCQLLECVAARRLTVASTNQGGHFLLPTKPKKKEEPLTEKEEGNLCL